MLIPIRPGDAAYIDNSGSTFVAQDEQDNLNVAYYEINAEGDTIDFEVTNNAAGFELPILRLFSVWGPTDFTLVDLQTGDPIISEQSGFDNDQWIIDISGTSGRFRLTDFDTGAGVDGTQAAWLPFVEVLSAES